MTEGFKTFLEFIAEGNPLGRLKSHIDGDRHFVAISAERKNLSPQENKQRMTELKAKVAAQGYGYKRSKGMWEGGSERSIVVHAKKAGDGHGDKLVRHMLKHAADYDQDSILHHSGKEAKLIGTNSTGFPGKGNKEPIGAVKYNRPEAPFQTDLKPSRNKSARFTTAND